jgi:hypothetical protein
MTDHYTGPWRNTEPCFKAAMYIQMCKPDELRDWDPKLYRIIMTWGSCFDNDWEYWINPKMTRIRRTPIGRGKRTWTEKPKRYEPNHKLELFCATVGGIEKKASLNPLEMKSKSINTTVP